MSSLNQCYTCQKLFKEALIQTRSCKHQICCDCLQNYKNEVRSEINQNPKRGNAFEKFKCPSYKTTMCPTQYSLENVDQIFQQNLKIHTSLINDKQNHLQNQFNQLQEESKQQNSQQKDLYIQDQNKQIRNNYNPSIAQSSIQNQNSQQNHNMYMSQQRPQNQNLPFNQQQQQQQQNQKQESVALEDKSNHVNFNQEVKKQESLQQSVNSNIQQNKNYPLQDFEEEVQENNNKDKLNNLYSTQIVKPTNKYFFDVGNNQANQQNRNLIQSSFPQCQMIQDNNINNNQIQSQQAKMHQRLQKILKKQSSLPNPQYQQSKYAPKNEERIPWDNKKFKQYQEMYNQALTLLKKAENQKKLEIALYMDPHPQFEKIGEIQTFRDFANKECISSDEKLETAKSYGLIGSRKPIRGDGNCFYRAVISQLLEKIFISSYANRALKLLGQIMDEKEFQIIEVISDFTNQDYQNQITDLVRLNLIQNMVNFIQQRCDLEKKADKKISISNSITKAFNQDNCNFDFSAVVLGRSYGALALQVYGQSKEYRDFCNDIEQLQQILYIYGQDVESTIVPIITETLDITLKIHNFEKVKNKWDIYAQEYQPKCYTINLKENQNQEPFMHHYVDVLLHQGHYESILTPNYTKNVYGNLKDNVKDFDRVEHERIQKEKLLRSQFKIKIEVDICNLCKNQSLTANTKQCDHRYCAECLQRMITFMEERNFTFYNCHYEFQYNSGQCGKHLLLQEFLEMIEAISIYQQMRQELKAQNQFLQKKCCRCKESLKNKIFVAKNCNHQYCDKCIQYIYNLMLSDDSQKIQQCRYRDDFGNNCQNQMNEEDVLEMIAKN